MIFNSMITNLSTDGKGVLELLYTEGAEITAEDWVPWNFNVRTSGNTNAPYVSFMFPDTKFKKNNLS